MTETEMEQMMKDIDTPEPAAPLIEKVKLISDLCGLIAKDYGCSITHSSQMAVEVECFLNEYISKFSTGVKFDNLDSLGLN